MYLVHSRFLTSGRETSWSLQLESFCPPELAPDLATALCPPSFWQAVGAAPTKRYAHLPAPTAGHHGHSVATAASLGSVLLGMEVRPWGFRKTLTLEQR